MPLNPNMDENVFASYLKERLLKAKQTPIHVINLPKKPTTRERIEPLSSQRVGFENKQLGITWFWCLLVLFRMGKWWFQHVLLNPKE